VTAIRQRETYGEMGEAMRALPNERWRDFVRYYLTGKPLRGAAEAYRRAGFQAGDTLNDARNAYQLLHDDRMQRALAEESRKHYRAAIPGAVEAVKEILADPDHKDRARIAQGLLDRVDPLITRHEMGVTHRVLSADDEALEELRAARHLGASREKLIELFGGNYLPKLEQMEAQKAAAAKIVNGETIDSPTPTPEYGRTVAPIELPAAATSVAENDPIDELIGAVEALPTEDDF
jgi:hypothetical protein